MEHARLVINALAQFESLLRPLLESRTPRERSELSRAIVEWLAQAPNGLLRAALLDQPCPAEFFEKWLSPDELKNWLASTPEGTRVLSADPCGRVCARPSEFAEALRALQRN
jgi:hypothetical protein